jgi:hypothetical protein
MPESSPPGTNVRREPTRTRTSVSCSHVSHEREKGQSGSLQLASAALRGGRCGHPSPHVDLQFRFWRSSDFFVIIPIFSLIGLVAIAVVIRGQPRRSLAIVSMLVAFWAVSWVLQRNELKMRTEVRWLFRSKDYKTQVLAQPVLANGELRHIEWDGWGGPGAGDTVVYLVFDPTDSLAAAASSHESGKFKGIPCEIPDVRRLEKNWYTALFYADADWDHCA